MGWEKLDQTFENLLLRDLINSDCLLIFKSNYKIAPAVGADIHGLVSLCGFSPSGSPYDFISLEWLQKWLDESTPPKPIDNTACLCSHGKLHPDKISLMKRISEYVADFFYRRYGGGPRLNGNILSKSPPGMWFGAFFWSQPCFEPSFIIITLFQCMALVLPYFQGIFLISLNSISQLPFPKPI